MTVSLRRPEDGERQPTAANKGVEADDKSQSTLPPTLFKLPNLHACKEPKSSMEPADTAHPLAAQAAESKDTVGKEVVPKAIAPLTFAAPTTAAAPAAAPAPTTPPVPAAAPTTAAAPAPSTPPVPAAVAAPAPAPTFGVAPSTPSADTPTAPAASASAPASPGSTDIPAARTWMEKIGSHALVLVMLLLVVAAALFTGQGSDDPSGSENSIADNASDELDFSIGEKIDLPIPDHPHPPLALELANETASASGLGTVTIESPATDLKKDSFEAIKQEVERSSSEKIPAASVALKVPAASIDASTAPHAEASPRVEMNQFVNGSTSIDATAVSNRTDTNHSPDVPTLEELETGDAGLIGVPTHSGPHFSRTPFGITDWMGPLDEFINEAAASQSPVAATDTDSSTSN